MITKREKNLSWIMIVVQLMLTVSAFFLTQIIYPARFFKDYEDIFILFQVIIIWGFFLSQLKLGVIFRGNFKESGLRGYFTLIFFGVLILYLEVKLKFILRDTGQSLKFIFLFGLIDFLFLIAFKFAFYYIMRFIRRKGHNTKFIIFIADSTTMPFIDFFVNAKDWGYKIQAILTHDNTFKCKYNEIRVIRDEDNLKNY